MSRVKIHQSQDPTPTYLTFNIPEQPPFVRHNFPPLKVSIQQIDPVRPILAIIRKYSDTFFRTEYANESDGRFADETDDPNRIEHPSDILISSNRSPLVLFRVSPRLHSWPLAKTYIYIRTHTRVYARRVKVCNLLA